MKNTKFLVLLLAIFAFFAIFADETPDSEVPDTETPDAEAPDSENPPAEDNMGKMIGGKPAMSWEDGGQDFFVMFNSNVDNKVKLYGETDENPQGDTCVKDSSFTLDKFHIPDDAIIEKAYLVWMGAVDPAKLNDPTDNKVHLAFAQTKDEKVKYEADILAGEEGKGKKLTDEPSFDFEGIRYDYPVTIGCSETEEGESKNMEIGYFTYRVDVTDFFNQIYEKNKEVGNQEGTGEFYGKYTFSDLDCTDHDAYKCQTTMVSAWSLFFIYRSKHIKPKKIYVYNGLSFVYAAESVADVSGFEFGQYPTLRVTTMIAEGDPGLTNKDIQYEEGITLLGENGGKPYKLKNKCNTFASDGHIEVYNSVSSIVNWDPKAEGDNQIQCVSGLEDETINYGIDVDTFLLDSEKEINLQEHLQHVDDPSNPDKKDSIKITLSVNQDAIFTNFMILSLDIKGSSFDIPGEDEKYACSCPAAEQSEYYYCPYVNKSKPFYYLVKVQNWGGEETGKVTISDELDSQLDYVPGTTEFATKFNDKGDGTDWTVIPDKDGGAFPLSGSGYELGEKMQACREEGGKKICSDKILVRYKVVPKKGIAKNYVFTNIALLKDSNSEDEAGYKTNSSYPLKLKPVTCVPDCDSPEAKDCGGVKDERECGDGVGDCPQGFVCQDSKCVDDPSLLCSTTAAEIAIGQNSPQSDNSTIITRDNDGRPLVVGQFTIQSKECEEGKFISFDNLRVHLDTKNDANFEFSDYELIYDADGNGVYDEAVDSIVSNGGDVEENNRYVYFTLKSTEKKYVGKLLSNFIVRVKVNYKEGVDVTSGTSFQFYLETGADAMINKSQDATLVLGKSENRLNFATFFLEPTGDYFIATIGPKDPAVPAIDKINSNIPVMQLRTKSIGKENAIERIKIKVPNNAVKFGEKNGITGISIWIDTNNDGIGEEKVAEKTSFKAGEASLISFEKEDFTKTIKYYADEEKYLVINVDFNMVKADPPMVGKIIVQNFKLKDSSATVYDGNPINSKAYTYACKDGDVNCQQASGSKSGCAVLEVEADNTGIIVVAAVLSAVAMLGFALLRKKLF